MLGYSNIRMVCDVNFAERSVELMWRGTAQEFRENGLLDCVDCSSLVCSGCGSLLSSSFRVYVVGCDSCVTEAEFDSVPFDCEISAFVICKYSQCDV